MFKKIRRDVAKRLFESGVDVYALPNKLSVDSKWVSPFRVSNDYERSFDSICNEIIYYNCSSECGRALAFYRLEA